MKKVGKKPERSWWRGYEWRDRNNMTVSFNYVLERFVKLCAKEWNKSGKVPRRSAYASMMDHDKLMVPNTKKRIAYAEALAEVVEWLDDVDNRNIFFVLRGYSDTTLVREATEYLRDEFPRLNTVEQEQ